MADPLIESLASGLDSVVEYLAEHVLTCLIPAFFIAGAIAALVKKDVILRYFGPMVRRRISYPIASTSGTILAVCSCTILPIFAGIYKKGSGIGPATAFLYAGPAINVLAIVYTATVLGYDIGAARAVSAISMSIVIGLIMAHLFRADDSKSAARDGGKTPPYPTERESRPRKVTLLFFVLLITILVIGASGLDPIVRLVSVYFLTVGITYLLVYYFKKDEVTEWGYETWDLTKKIFPILITGTFIVGVIAYFLPAETFRPYLGGNGVGENLLAAVIGTVLYMPTLLEVPIIGTTFGYTTGVMGAGPALTLLLAGPAVSLPSMIVIQRIIGTKRMLAFIGSVMFISAMAGYIYGNLFG